MSATYGRLGDSLLIGGSSGWNHNHGDASVLALPGGNYVVVWTSDGFAKEFPITVYSVFDGGGRFLKGGGFNPGWGQFVYEPSILPASNGGFLVGSRATQGYGYQLFDAEGNPVGKTFLGQVQSATVLTDGSLIFCWTSSTGDGSGSAIMGQRVDALGNLIGSQFIANSTAQGDQRSPMVQHLPDGGFTISWTDAGAGAASILRSQRYDSTGGRVGPEAIVGTGPPDSPGSNDLPDGGRISVWVGSDASGNAIRAQVFDDHGDPVGGEILVASLFEGRVGELRTTVLANGAVLVCWTELGGQYGPGGGDVLTQILFPNSATESGDVATDTSGDDLLFLGGGDDRFVITTGRDRINGGQGLDTLTLYWGDATAGVTSLRPPTEDVGGGYKGVFSVGSARSVDYLSIERFDIRTGAGADVLTTGGGADQIQSGAGADSVFGMGGNDYIAGGSGNDSLDGGEGNDTTAGGVGDDVHYVDSANDQVTELQGEGRDFIYTTSNYTLRTGVEVEVLRARDLTGTAALVLVGNEVANVIHGNAGANILRGGAGDDILLGYLGDDNLDGGAGADNLTGGLGDDTYHVDSANDVVVENAGEGRDTIFSQGHYNLREFENVELLVAADRWGTAALNFTGNSLANIIKGNAGANVLRGGAGDDVLLGYEGDDNLDGGAGADNLTGGLGDDTYHVDSANDVVVENASEGRDTIFSQGHYNLREFENIELLVAADRVGTTAVNFTGNSLANILKGNAGVNVLRGAGGDDILLGYEGDDNLDGGAGADVMTGGFGDDVYFVDTASDVIVELAGEGRDRVFVSGSYILRETESIEYLSTIDKAARTAINITGNSSDNIIYGNAGRNIFDGKGGNDILVGLEDADRFLFSSTLNGSTNVDTIVGFEIGYDKIWLDDAVFTGLNVGALAAGAFVVGSAAADADDRIIYNAVNGSLMFDRDGVGGAAAVQFALVDPDLIVTAYDFLIY